MFGVAVNHFHKPEHPVSVRQSTKFALSLLKNCPEVTTIFLVDSSEKYDADLDEFCQTLGVNYRHYGRTLSFAEAYNFGVACLDEEWVVTMASDIYVRPETFGVFRQFIENNPAIPIGCLIPYLSSSDYIVQEATINWPKPSCYCGVMTYNLNVFPKAVFTELGGLSNKFSGNYNDIDTSIRLKNMGLKIVLVSNYVQHYGRLTLPHGTNVKSGVDEAQFRLEHPDFAGDAGRWGLRLDKLLEHRILKLISKLSFTFRPRRFRGSIGSSLELWVLRNLPAIQRIDH